MSRHLLLTSLFATTLATFAIGCVDLSQSDGCTSDDECRFGRTCSELTGRCEGPETMPVAIDDEADADADVDVEPAPDALPGPDVAPTPDVYPMPDIGPGEPDVPGTPDIGMPEVGSPDVESCSVVAHARVKLDGSNQWRDSLVVDTLQTVHFDATTSEGDVTGYEWSILAKPEGATQRLLPDAASTNPRLYVDLLGLYRVQLTVFGETASGAACQDTVTLEVRATPTSDLHVQLTWDTPGDPDQTDTHGSDLDLHYLHPSGRFGQPPEDIFWPNPTSDWGVPGASDDPTLEVDDTDGAGPEYVSHSGLENVDYEIGVQLNNHRDYGSSFATIRVYHMGQLILELKNRHMDNLGEFWHVAMVNGNGSVNTIDMMLDGYPSL